MIDGAWIGACHAERTDHLPVTVAETRTFSKNVLGMMDEEELVELKMAIAVNPEQGDVIPGTGGVRKLRWALGNRGKRSGARVVYYYHDDDMPIFLLAAYKKNEKINLTEGEKKMIKQLVTTLVREYR